MTYSQPVLFNKVLLDHSSQVDKAYVSQMNLVNISTAQPAQHVGWRPT